MPKRLTLNSCLLLVLLLLSRFSLAQNSMLEIDRLVADSRYAEAIEFIVSQEEALAATERPCAWTHDFQGEVVRTAHGKHHVYYQLSIANSHKKAPGRADPLPEVSVNTSRSDRNAALVCIELETGQINWSRMVNGLVSFAVDPRSDILYLYRKKLIGISAETGEIITQYDLTDGIQGLLFGSEMATSHIRGRIKIDPTTVLKLHDPITKQDTDVSMGELLYRSPNGKYRIIQGEHNLEFVPPSDVQKKQSSAQPIFPSGPPLWVDNRPFFVTDHPVKADAVVGVNPIYGHVLWSYRLPWGSYKSERHQLRGGGYPDRWLPLAALDSSLLALDDRGTLIFLDPYTRIPEFSAHLNNDHIGMSFQYKEQVIVSSFKWMRSYSIAELMTPDSSVLAALKLKRAECLFNLGNNDGSLALLDEIIDHSPAYSAAWHFRSKLLAAMRDNEDELFSYNQYMTHAGIVSDKKSYDDWGLLRRYNMEGKPAWSLSAIENHVYGGTLGGKFWSVQRSDLDFQMVSDLRRKIQYIYTELDVDFWPQRRASYERRSYPRAETKVDRAIDPEWYKQGGVERIGPVISYRGRSYRTVTNGAVRELIDSNFVTHPPLLGDIGAWNVHFTSTAPLGYGSAVYELDEHLRPVRLLIDPMVNGVKPEKLEVQFIQTYEQTIGLVFSSSEGAFMQVYSLEGKLLNEVVLGRFLSSRASENDLIVVHDGYFFSDRQLHWVAAKKKGRIWKFGPSITRTTGERYGYRWRYFGDPIFLNGCLYVTALDGHLYIFDTVKIRSGE